MDTSLEICFTSYLIIYMLALPPLLKAKEIKTCVQCIAAACLPLFLHA
jgi:hypothetical protein